VLELEELKLSFSVEGHTGSAGAGEAKTFVSMKNPFQRATTAAIEPGPQQCGYIKRWPAEARIHIAPRFRAVLSDGAFCDGSQNGDAK
jgi:hypothetical protein